MTFRCILFLYWSFNALVFYGYVYFINLFHIHIFIYLFIKVCLAPLKQHLFPVATFWLEAIKRFVSLKCTLYSENTEFDWSKPPISLFSCCFNFFSSFTFLFPCCFIFVSYTIGESCFDLSPNRLTTIGKELFFKPIHFASMVCFKYSVAYFENPPWILLTHLPKILRSDIRLF